MPNGPSGASWASAGPDIKGCDDLTHRCRSTPHGQDRRYAHRAIAARVRPARQELNNTGVTVAAGPRKVRDRRHSLARIPECLSGVRLSLLVRHLRLRDLGQLTCDVVEHAEGPGDGCA